MDKAYIKAIIQIRILSIIVMSLVVLFAVLSLMLNNGVLQNLAFVTAVAGLSLVTFKMVRVINSAKE